MRNFCDAKKICQKKYNFATLDISVFGNLGNCKSCRFFMIKKNIISIRNIIINLLNFFITRQINFLFWK